MLFLGGVAHGKNIKVPNGMGRYRIPIETEQGFEPDCLISRFPKFNYDEYTLEQISIDKIKTIDVMVLSEITDPFDIYLLCMDLKRKGVDYADLCNRS